MTAEDTEDSYAKREIEENANQTNSPHCNTMFPCGEAEPDTAHGTSYDRRSPQSPRAETFPTLTPPLQENLVSRTDLLVWHTIDGQLASVDVKRSVDDLLEPMDEESDQLVNKRPMNMLRLGKRPMNMLRLGKRPMNMLRLGERPVNMLRLGKRPSCKSSYMGLRMPRGVQPTSSQELTSLCGIRPMANSKTTSNFISRTYLQLRQARDGKEEEYRQVNLKN